MREGGDGKIDRRWNNISSHLDKYINSSLGLLRKFNLKYFCKVNNTNASSKRRDSGYDPAYTYDAIFCILFDNEITLTRNIELDLTGNENFWVH